MVLFSSSGLCVDLHPVPWFLHGPHTVCHRCAVNSWCDVRTIKWFFLRLSAILTFVLDESLLCFKALHRVLFYSTAWVLPPSFPPFLFRLPLPISSTLHLPVPPWSLSDLSLSSLADPSLLLLFKVWVSGVLFISMLFSPLCKGNIVRPGAPAGRL